LISRPTRPTRTGAPVRLSARRMPTRAARRYRIAPLAVRRSGRRSRYAGADAAAGRPLAAARRWRCLTTTSTPQRWRRLFSYELFVEPMIPRAGLIVRRADSNDCLLTVTIVLLKERLTDRGISTA